MQTFDTAEHLIEQANPAIFVLETETGMGDRRMLLALQNIVRRRVSGYAYAEVGSYMGGSLVPHLMDRRCALVLSIDRRPDVQPDERGVSFDYTRSSTAAMLDRLHENLPLPAMLKLVTHDCDAADLPADAGAVPFDLMFIDGEHTNRAAFSDFLSLWRFAKPDCIAVFHDANLVPDALANVQSFLRHQGVTFASLVLPDLLFAVFAGGYARLAPALARFATDTETFFETSKRELWKQIASIPR